MLSTYPLRLFLLFCLYSITFQIPTIVVQNSSPMVICTPGDTGTSEFDGIEIQMFNEIYTSFGLTDGSWQYECVASEADIYSKLQSDPSTYIAGFGAMQSSLNRLLQGFQFSSPTLHTGLTLIILPVRSLLYFRIISKELLFLLLGTAVFMAILQYYFEEKCFPFEKYLWNAFAQVFFVTVVRLRGVPARIIMCTYWLIILIVTSNYGANLTAVMSFNQESQEIMTISDLNGATIRTTENYTPRLGLYGAKAFLNTSEINSANVNSDLTAGYASGYAVEDSMAMVLERQDCTFAKRLRLFDSFDYVIAFGSSVSSSTQSTVNKALIDALLTTRSFNRMENFVVNYNKLSNQCLTDLIIDDKIQLKTLYVLVYCMCAGAAISVILHLVNLTKCAKRFSEYLVKKNIISEVIAYTEDDKLGDDLVVENLKEVTHSTVKGTHMLIKERLDLMEDRVTRFYEKLFSTQMDQIPGSPEVNKDQVLVEDTIEMKIEDNASTARRSIARLSPGRTERGDAENSLKLDPVSIPNPDLSSSRVGDPNYSGFDMTSRPLMENDKDAAMRKFLGEK